LNYTEVIRLNSGIPLIFRFPAKLTPGFFYQAFILIILYKILYALLCLPIL